MNYKAVFLDIDGTILMPDHTYSNSTVEAIKQLKSQGILVFIATGRPLHEIEELASELSIDNFISYNGAHAIYQDNEIVNEPLDKSTIQQFLNTVSREQHELVLYTNGKNHLTAIDDPATKAFIETFEMNKNTIHFDLSSDKVFSATLLKLKPEDVSLYQWDDKIHLSQVNVPGMEHAYDVIRSNVNKGEAIKKVLTFLNINKEQVIAFGDGLNDKEMFSSVGISFAMGNSDPKLFQYASHRTTSVSDSGIYNGLKLLGLVEQDL